MSTDDGRVTGVVLADGTELSASVVVSSLDPRRTFTELVNPRELPTDLVENIERFKFRGTASKVNFALDGPPVYPALGGRTDQYGGFINVGPSIEYLEKAFDAVEVRLVQRTPVPRLLHPVLRRPRHGAGGQARHVVLRAAHALRAEGEHLGEGAREPRRHRAEHAGVVLPGLLEPRAAPRDRHAGRHREGHGAVGGQHLRGRVPGAADVLLPPGAGLEPVPHADRRLLPVRVRHAPRWLCRRCSRDASPASKS